MNREDFYEAAMKGNMLKYMYGRRKEEKETHRRKEHGSCIWRAEGVMGGVDEREK